MVTIETGLLGTERDQWGIGGARAGLAATTDVHAVASRFRLLDVHEGYIRAVTEAIYGSPYYSKPLQPPLTCKHETRSSWHCTVYDNTTRELHNLVYECGLSVQARLGPTDLTVSWIHKFYEIVVAPHLILEMLELNCSNECNSLEEVFEQTGISLLLEI